MVNRVLFISKVYPQFSQKMLYERSNWRKKNTTLSAHAHTQVLQALDEAPMKLEKIPIISHSNRPSVVEFHRVSLNPVLGTGDHWTLNYF